MISWQTFPENVIDESKNKEHNFNHLEEKNNITLANKMDMSYDICNKNNMHAVECKLNAMINKNKTNKNKKTKKNKNQ